MRIAVISDTHDRFPESVAREIAGADEIWHLGDICQPSILTTVKSLGPPVRWVRGNCDAAAQWPLTLDFELEGFRIRLVHIPPDRAPAGVDLLFHGHTHVPRHERIGATQFLNPGCISRADRGAPASYAWLELQRDQPIGWNLKRV